MKNKNGFTLIELLVVVALLGIIGVIITVNIVTVFKSTETKGCDDFINKIESNACIFVATKDNEVNCPRSTGCEITLGDLVVNGYIEEEKDQCTMNDIDMNQKITITWDDDGAKECHYEGPRVYEGK